jgi:hypothetical protein
MTQSRRRGRFDVVLGPSGRQPGGSSGRSLPRAPPVSRVAWSQSYPARPVRVIEGFGPMPQTGKRLPVAFHVGEAANDLSALSTFVGV